MRYDWETLLHYLVCCSTRSVLTLKLASVVYTYVVPSLQQIFSLVSIENSFLSAFPWKVCIIGVTYIQTSLLKPGFDVYGSERSLTSKAYLSFVFRGVPFIPSAGLPGAGQKQHERGDT